jgi:hypothetical protein
MLSFWAKLLNAPLPQLTTKFASLGLEPSIFPAVQRACSTRVHNGNNKPMQTNTSSSSNSSRDAGIHDSIKEHNYNNQQDVDKLEYDDYQDYQDSHEAQEGMIDKQQLLRQLIRQTHLAEVGCPAGVAAEASNVKNMHSFFTPFAGVRNKWKSRMHLQLFAGLPLLHISASSADAMDALSECCNTKTGHCKSQHIMQPHMLALTHVLPA